MRFSTFSAPMNRREVGRPRVMANNGMSDVSDIDAVVFSGRGARCFWQAGFWQSVKASLPRPAVVGAVSGGAAVAAVLFAGGGWPRFFPRFIELVASNKGNVQLGNLLLRQPMFPHAAISRDSFLHSVSLRGLERLCTGLDFRIVISHPPRLLGAVLGSAVAATVDELEKRVTRPLCRCWVKVLGFHTCVVRARDCRTPEELVHAIFQSSAAPPFFPVTRRNGNPAIDGGLVENVPLSTVAECRRPLVLLSRDQRELPSGGREIYACPSGPVPVPPWDFSSPDKVIETFELGCRDGARFLEKHMRPTAENVSGRTI